MTKLLAILKKLKTSKNWTLLNLTPEQIHNLSNAFDTIELTVISGAGRGTLPHKGVKG